MPKTTNEEYNKFITQNEIELIDQDQLQEWLDNMPNKKIPPKCSVEQAQALLISMYYTGARPSEIVEVCGKDIYKKKYENKSVYEIKLITLKKGISRNIPIPINKQTKLLYDYAKKQHPELFIFYSFRKNAKIKVSWNVSKDILIKENGVITQDKHIEHKQKEYLRRGHMLNYYTKMWTGKLAYFFRHHRFSFMADKGASDNDIQFMKGSRTPKSVEPYKHMSIQRKSKLTKFF